MLLKASTDPESKEESNNFLDWAHLQSYDHRPLLLDYSETNECVGHILLTWTESSCGLLVLSNRLSRYFIALLHAVCVLGGW